jgi:ankyrin repeat protein
MCKFLMRRGCNVNAQNLVGNTGMHYCYAYHHEDLGAYLRGKGGNDSILNGEGLTCYEGLSRNTLGEL